MSNCPNLEVVTMAGLKQITDTVALAIAHCCPKMQHLSFRNCEVTDLGICELAAHCSQLSLLAVAGVHSLTDKSIIAIAEHCPYLEDLYISGCEKITKQAVTYLKVTTEISQWLYYLFSYYQPRPRSPTGDLGDIAGWNCKQLCQGGKPDTGRLNTDVCLCGSTRTSGCVVGLRRHIEYYHYYYLALPSIILILLFESVHVLVTYKESLPHTRVA